MSFNDYLNTLVIEKEDILLQEDIIPTKEEATFSLFRSILNFFEYILNLSFLRKNKSK